MAIITLERPRFPVLKTRVEATGPLLGMEKLPALACLTPTPLHLPGVALPEARGRGGQWARRKVSGPTYSLPSTL